jgi:amidophosphoribosyltransferase
VIIDDSIVRGTTLKNEYYENDGSFELQKSIVVVSSAPQIRFPDCYGIDMAK